MAFLPRQKPGFFKKPGFLNLDAGEGILKYRTKIVNRPLAKVKVKSFLVSFSSKFLKCMPLAFCLLPTSARSLMKLQGQQK